MPDWTKTMEQDFEYYIVDPNTWRDTERLKNVKACTINRDISAETLGSATIDIDGMLGECYIRVYLITIQGGLRERHVLGTFLVQTPTSKYDGKVQSVSLDAYTPLLELKEKSPPLGYALFKDENVMTNAFQIIREQARAPVVKAQCVQKLCTDFVANIDDTWLTYIRDLVSYANYELDLDENGRIIFQPKTNIAALQPVHTFDDGNSSILYPEISIDYDIYNIPNVIEAIYSDGNHNYSAKAVNDNPNSIVSTVSRGREILLRITNPELPGNPTKRQVQEYAEQKLAEASTVKYTVSYTHGYYPVRPRDCVRLDYAKANMSNIKAKVISQTIKCEAGCPVTEKATYSAKL